MNPKVKKIAKFVVRWGIAVAGIGWVISNISLHNRVLMLNPATKRPAPVRLATAAKEADRTFRVLDPFSQPGKTVETELRRNDLFVKSDRDLAAIDEPDGTKRTVEVLGLKVTDNDDRKTWPILVARPRTFWMKYTGSNWGDEPQLVEPARLANHKGYDIRVPYPIVETGLGPMTAQAMRNNPWLLIAAIAVFPVTFLITSYRWHLLLELLDIRMGLGRTFVINMVGCFYNTFLPGSTGGDLLKAYYAAKQTTHRTRAVMSVIIDRILGLLALVILGGAMATAQYFRSGVHDDVTRKCGQVALGSGAIIVATIIGLIVFYLRKPLGLDWVVKRLPMQEKIVKAIDTMEIYRRHPVSILWAVVMTLPVHATVVLSAMFAGMAFGLPMHWGYYWVCIPVIVLSGAIPISPQGAGVMEFFAILLTRSQGVTVAQAFALCMSIRCVQIVWNLTGGIFVLRGGYHAPNETEQHDLATDLPEDPGPGPAERGIQPA